METPQVEAWKRGAKGCTTFRIDGKRFGIMKSLDEVIPEHEVQPVDASENVLAFAGEACIFDPATGTRSCE